MPDLPHIILPDVAYHALLCSLFTLLSWHLLTLVSAWLHRRVESRVRSKD